MLLNMIEFVKSQCDTGFFISNWIFLIDEDI